MSKGVKNLLTLDEEIPALYIGDRVKIRVVRQKPLLISARYLQVIEGSTQSSKLPETAIVEDSLPLPRGLVVGCTIVTVDSTGTVPL